MNTLSSIAQTVTTTLSHLFGLNADIPPQTHPTADVKYHYVVLDNGGRTVDSGTVWTHDNPAMFAMRLAKDNPWYTTYGYRVWIKDGRFRNEFPWRFRLIQRNGEPLAKIIDPRAR